MRKNIITFLIILLALKTFSQDNKDSTDLQFLFNIEAQSFYQPNIKLIRNGEFYSVHNDIVSDIWGNPVPPKFEYVTDNPFNHSAFYARLNSTSSYKNKYILSLDVVIEHRGMSRGINDLNSIVVFPLYRFDIYEKFKVFNDSLDFTFKLGCFTNNKVHQGLKIYNLNAQGFKLNLEWKDFNIQFQDIADLSFGVGLMLEELHDISFVYKKLFSKRRTMELGINSSFNSYSMLNNASDVYNISGYFNFGAFGEFHFSNKWKAYFQYEMRNTPYLNIAENSAVLLGVEFTKQISKISFSLNPEFRYYGWVYNYGHKNDSVSYRFDENSEHDYETQPLPSVGQYLYPLMNYNNQFSQWAVYTDYQYQNIAGFELRAKFHWQFHNRFSFNTDIETMTLLKEFESNGSNLFTYLFYTNSLICDLGKKFIIRLDLSNKAMNLDKHYQTFYMSTTPYLGFCIRKEI